MKRNSQNEKPVKEGELTRKEISEWAKRYKRLKPANRSMLTMITNVLLVSQESGNEERETAGRQQEEKEVELV